MSYDVIGDIHGHAHKLEALLQKLGYRNTQGAWRHPSRTVLFVGDFIDRGPGQFATIDIVRRMVDAGSAQAVMGNHEFNAIAWFFPDPAEEGAHLRPRHAQNRHQHQAFLAEAETEPARHHDVINWFMQLPLWLELPDLRVIHACWHPGHMANLKGCLDERNCLNQQLVEAASRRDSPAFLAVETLLKGIEVSLPEGVSYFDKDGHERHKVRTRWWDAAACTYRKAALMESSLRQELPELPIPDRAQLQYSNDKPLFIGHYWRSGQPQPLTPFIACVDYSAGKGGPLVAYRWDGEPELGKENFIAA